MDKILLVDDEPAVLAGYQRSLYREFEVKTAVGGELGLEAIRDFGPFAVIVSDMRMPGMSGAQFLAQASWAAPDSVRMLLTGFTDIDAAISAVNQGNIFRFLTKPCAKENLILALNAGVNQYRLIRAEKDLLEKTLLGSIKVMIEVLNAANSETFHRSTRIAFFVGKIADKFALKSRWRLDAAATLSQLGCVTLDADLLQRATLGVRLSTEDQARFDAHPAAAMLLLASIPRLESVAWIVGQQRVIHIPTKIPELPDHMVEETILGAHILKLAVAYDNLLMKSISEEDAMDRLRTRKSEFSPQLLQALVGVNLESRGMVSRRMLVINLAAGMVLDQDLESKEGLLIIPKGQLLTTTLLIKIRNFLRAGRLNLEVTALVPL